jgi:hypothetical protein
MAKVPFKISARAASLIGQENIANAEGAIIEIVKNAFDADAKECLVLFCREKEEDVLYIIDDGEGMTKVTLEEHWMTIGTSNKLHNPRTVNKRIKSGAKGIGRFALNRLGNSAKINTAPKKSNVGLEWAIEWDEFTDKKTLDQVYADLSETKNFDLTSHINKLVQNFEPLKDKFKNNRFNFGTAIRIAQLRDQWTENEISNLFKTLEILVPPREAYDFSIHLYDFSQPTKYGQVNTLVNDDYDYKLIASIDKDQKFTITVDRREFNWKEIDKDIFKEKQPKDMSKFPYDYNTVKNGEFSYSVSLKEFWPGITSNEESLIKEIGAFDFTFYYMKVRSKDRDKYALKSFDSNNRTKWLNTFGGIKLYRDGFRIRPYGEIQSNSFDWLGLGKRAASSSEGPGQSSGYRWRVEPQQVFGIINISRFTNPFLQDTSNRSGLHENEHYFKFAELITKLINVVEADRYHIMRPMSVVYERKNPKDLNISRAKEQAEETLQKAKTHKKAKSGFALKPSSDKEIVYANAVVDYEKILEEKDEEIKFLQTLGSLGLTLATFSHELDELNDDSRLYLNKLEKIINTEISFEKFEKISTRVNNPFSLISELQVLNKRMDDWLNFAKTSLKRDRRKAQDLELQKYFVEFHGRWSEFLQTRRTSFKIIQPFGTIKIGKSYPIDFDSIFNNLLLNSIDAFFRKDSSVTRQVTISHEIENKGISIIYEDSGPGLHKDIKDERLIFEPFFTTKKKDNEEIGIGLGMWIVKSTIERYNGYIEILNSRPHFKLKIFFPNFKK